MMAAYFVLHLINPTKSVLIVFRQYMIKNTLLLPHDTH